MTTLQDQHRPGYETKENRVPTLFDIADGRTQAGPEDPVVIVCVDQQHLTWFVAWGGRLHSALWATISAQGTWDVLPVRAPVGAGRGRRCQDSRMGTERP